MLWGVAFVLSWTIAAIFAAAWLTRPAARIPSHYDWVCEGEHKWLIYATYRFCTQCGVHEDPWPLFVPDDAA